MHLIRVIVTIAALAAGPIAVAVPASAAPAISPACSATPACQGFELKAPDLAMAVQGGTVLPGTPLIVATFSVAPAQDFSVRAQPSRRGLRIEFAPGGVRSGLCVSEPDPHVGTAIVLRRCRDNGAQRWRRRWTGNAPYRVLVNGQSGLAIADPHSGPDGTPLRSRHVGDGDAFNELWKTIH